MGFWCVGLAAACGGGSDGDDVVVVEPVETVGFFDPCSFDEQCPLPSNCEPVAIDYGDVIVEDAFCTVTCFDDFDCPSDGICLDAATGAPLCYQLCFDDFDCAPGFACIDSVGDFVFEPTCIPF
jgi:hypothetical protein